jgi:hypothetical protein
MLREEGSIAGIKGLGRRSLYQVQLLSSIEMWELVPNRTLHALYVKKGVIFIPTSPLPLPPVTLTNCTTIFGLTECTTLNEVSQRHVHCSIACRIHRTAVQVQEAVNTGGTRHWEHSAVTD